MATELMILDLPTVGALGTQGPDWATKLNAALEKVDVHDHTSGKGKKIPTAGLNMNADLSLAEFRMIDLETVVLMDLDAVLEAADDIGAVHMVDGDLYFTNGSGNAVKITSGDALSLSSLGTISGDYSTSDADLTYSDTSKTFVFLQAAGITANISSGPIKIYRNVALSKYSQLQIDAAQASNLTFTLPPAFPAASMPLIGSTGGVLTFSTVDTVGITDLAITTGKIAAGAITLAKMSSLSVDTAQIIDSSVTLAKLSFRPHLTYAEFLSSTTWLCPAAVTVIEVEGCGGGGGGGTTGGAGGSGAPYGRALVNVTPGTTYTITIGAGGIGGGRSGNTGEVAGTDGASSLIVGLLEFKGGKGGASGFGGAVTAMTPVRACGAAGGASATAGEGSVQYNGGAAGDGGGGGAGPYGNGANGRSGSNTQGDDAGANQGSGGGSGGGTASNGGHGGSGRLRISYILNT